MNNRDGTFSDEAATRGLNFTMNTPMGAVAADYDNDGDIDICTTDKIAPHVLLLNDGAGKFTLDLTQLPWPPNKASSPSWGDVDNDGLLELAVSAWSPASAGPDNPGNFVIYRNLGAGELDIYQFRTQPYNEHFSFTMRFADLDDNRYQDLTVTNDFGFSQLYLNQADSLFERVTQTHGTGSDE
jgi:hypothetical protein